MKRTDTESASAASAFVSNRSRPGLPPRVRRAGPPPARSTARLDRVLTHSYRAAARQSAAKKFPHDGTSRREVQPPHTCTTRFVHVGELGRVPLERDKDGPEGRTRRKVDALASGVECGTGRLACQPDTTIRRASRSAPRRPAAGGADGRALSWTGASPTRLSTRLLTRLLTRLPEITPGQVGSREMSRGGRDILVALGWEERWRHR